MSKIIFWIMAGYLFMFLCGYIPVRMAKEENQKVYCEKLFSSGVPIWILATIANGDANACLDLGYYPKDGE